MNRHTDPSEPGSSAAPDLAGMLLGLLEGTPEEIEAAIGRLCDGDPARGATIRERLTLLADRVDTPGEPDPASSLLDRLQRRRGGSADPKSSPVPREEYPDSAGMPIVDNLELTPDDRYRPDRVIGRGGMGLVYRAYDRDLRRPLALKVIRDDLDGSRASAVTAPSLRRFLEEAQVTGQLDHPGVVPVHELALDRQGRVYFTMRLVHGWTLGEVIKRLHAGDAGWTLTRAIEVMIKVCDTLAYVHSRGVIHRDLKPDNVMVGRYGEVYVMDWGLARAEGRAESDDPVDDPLDAPTASQLTREGSVLGTPCYMPPEQAAGRIEEMGVRSDVYSAGAMLYELLVGARPFERESSKLSVSELLEKIRSEKPGPVHALAATAPAELVSVCEKAMAPRSEDRYAGIEEMAEDLRAFLELRVVKAHQTGPWVELVKWVRRHRELAVTAAAALAIIVVGTALFTWRIDEQRERAETHLGNFDRLSLVVRLEEARARAAAMVPPWPERAAAMGAWLDREARDLRRALPALHEVLADLGAPTESTSTADRFLHRTLTALAGNIESFERHDVPDVAARLAWANRVDELTIARYRERWKEARRAVARADGVTASKRYAAVPIDLTPQMGLVPIGMDPKSKLWEFYHLRSGFDPDESDDPATFEIPTRNENGDLAVDYRGLVFVLIPGGRFMMGAQGEDEKAPNYDTRAWRGELPVHEVALAPFFLSKFEMTQGQWARLTGGEYPSRARPGRRIGSYLLEEVADSFPVESVSWEMCRALFSRYGLVLPTEAQWEYGCRAGTSTRWHTGNRWSSLRARANLPDHMPPPRRMVPVGGFPPNDFGLHDVHGNLWEWCRDWKSDYTNPPRPGDGLRALGPEPERVVRIYRGGCYRRPAREARSANRNCRTPNYRQYDIGVRPARPILP